MIFKCHRSIYILYPRLLIPTMEKVINHYPTEFSARKEVAVSHQSTRQDQK